MPLIPAARKAEFRRIAVQSQPGKMVLKIISQKKKKEHHKKELVEWLQVRVLSSNPQHHTPPPREWLEVDCM
jgi:hypothetical protein